MVINKQVPRQRSRSQQPRSQQQFKCKIALPRKGIKSSTLKGEIPIEINNGAFYFHLDEILLNQIQQAQTDDCRLRIPAGLATQLRQSALFDYILTASEEKIYPQSGLTFITSYLDPITDRDPQSVIYQTRQNILRTIVSLDGDIIHQLHKDCLEHPRCLEINQAHHWLVTQLLNQFRHSATQFTAVLAAVCAGAANVPNLLTLQGSSLISAIVILPLEFLVLWALWHLLVPWMLRLTLRQLLKTSTHQLGRWIFGRVMF